MIIQIILIAFIVILAFYGLAQRNTHSGRAWKKIALILLATAMIFAVIVPDVTNDIAHLIGVGRGADLLLYGLVVSFIFYALNNYLQQQDQRDKMYRLARKLALLEAQDRYRNKQNITK